MAKPVVYTDYETIGRIGSQYYADTQYCAVVALSVVARISFGKAFHTYRRIGRTTRKGVNMSMIVQALAAVGLRMERTLTHFGTMRTAGRNAHVIEGPHLVFCKGHVAAINDGKLIDRYESDMRRVQHIWRILPL